jgi:pilus assembly protein Flp/PilA
MAGQLPAPRHPTVVRLCTSVVRCVTDLGERLRRERGQGMVEYGLILILVAIAVVVALTSVGGQLKTVFNTIKNGLVT